MSDRILVGTRKGAFVAERRNGGWAPRLLGHSGQGVNFLARDPYSGTLWGALGHGHWGAKLSRSDDDGKTWADASQVMYPEGARHLLPPMPDETGTATGPTVLKEATLLKLWCMAFGGPGQIYVGTIPGGLFVSRDGGERFELNRPLWNHESRGGDLFHGGGAGETKWFGTPAAEGEFAPGLHSIVVDPRDPDRVLVAISTAGVFETVDGGQSWHSRNQGMTMDYEPDPTNEFGHDPHCIDLCPSDPDCIWQQNHCGVFFTENGAETWTKVSQPEQGIHFGFPVAADPSDGRTAWVVPGKSDMERTTVNEALFVGRTHDGGRTWEALREGLPQAHAYDVVLRHALATDGQRVAFGTTTGNLYVSDDRGERWHTVANNLPPIYSVRMG